MRFFQVLLGYSISGLALSCRPVTGNPLPSSGNTPPVSAISPSPGAIRTQNPSPLVQLSARPNTQPTSSIPTPLSPPLSNGLVAKVEPYISCVAQFVTSKNEKVSLEDGITPFTITPDQKYVYIYNKGKIYKIQKGDVDYNQPAGFQVHHIIASYDINSNRVSWLTANNTELYFTDGNQVKKINSSGEVQVVAGQMAAGYQDGPGSMALFKVLIGIVLDAQNNIYVVDNENSAIRKISAQTHEVTTLAGPGVPGSGIAPDGPAHETFVNDAYGIAVNPAGTKVFVAESGAIRIRLIENQQVRTLAGSGMDGDQDGPGNQAKFRTPDFIQLSHFQTLYVADPYSNLLREISPEGTVRTIAGDPKFDRKNCAEGYHCNQNGYGLDARFDGPSYLSQDVQGNLYLVSGGCSLKKINFVPSAMAQTAAVAIQAGGGP